MNISKPTPLLFNRPDNPSASLDSLGPEVTRFIEKKGGAATESQSKKLIDYLIAAHNERYGSHYLLAEAAENRKTAVSSKSVAELTRKKIKEKHQDTEAIIAVICVSLKQGKDAIKNTMRRNQVFCQDLIKIYVQQELIARSSKCDRFKAFDPFKESARLDVDSYRAMDQPALICEKLNDDLLRFRCSPEQAVMKVNALLKVTLGIEILESNDPRTPEIQDLYKATSGIDLASLSLSDNSTLK